MPTIRLSRLPLLLLLVAGFAPAAYADFPYSLRIDTPDENLTVLLGQYLSLAQRLDDTDLDADGFNLLVQETPGEVQELLRTEGYFNAKIDVERSSDAIPKVVVHVDPGAPVTVQSVSLDVTGAARGDEDFRDRVAAMREDWPLQAGRRFRQDDWDSAKRKALQGWLLDRYPAARIEESRARIDPDTHRADLRVVVDSGPSYRFGEIEVAGLLRYPQNLVLQLAPFKPGDAYRQGDLLSYQAALQQAPQFTTVLVDANPDSAVDGVIPVYVQVTEEKRHSLDLGLKYSTDVGPGVRIGHAFYNLFDKGWTLTDTANLNRDEQTVDVGVALPKTAEGYSYGAYTGLAHSDVQGLDTRSFKLGGFQRRQRGRIDATLGLEYTRESSRLNGVSNGTQQALIASYAWSRRDLDSELRPANGFLWNVQVGGAAQGLLSDTSFVRLYGKTAWYWTPENGKGTVVARVEAGQVWARDADEVPVGQLFRTGGSGSVRGYDYQSLGVSRNGAITGGRVVGSASLEYQYPIRPEWAAAAFIDAGNAADSWKGFRAVRGIGVGVRWFSPVAPLALDVAYGQATRKWRLHFSLGVAF